MKTIENNNNLETFQEAPITKVDWGEQYIEQFERNLKIRKYIVQRVLNQSEESTNNDFILQLHCLITEFKGIHINTSKDSINLIIPKKLLKNIPSPETYTRIRRKLNQEGIGLPTKEEVLERRKIKMQMMKKYYSSNRD